MTETHDHAPHFVTIHINGKPYQHGAAAVTPAEIRRIARPPIPDNKQLWLDVVDAPDQLLSEGEIVELENGLHFFSEIPAITITIDRHTCEVRKRKMTGAELRSVPTPAVAGDRDLWLDVPDGRDRKIQDEDVVMLTNHMRFYTAPGRINPGAKEGAGRETA
jgi:hypothetical protein